MLNMGEIATWAGWFATIAGLILLVIRPILSSFTKISDNLTKMMYSQSKTPNNRHNNYFGGNRLFSWLLLF